MLEVREEQTKTQHQHSEWVSGAEVERPLDLPLPALDDKVVQGQDGWLFIANDSDDTLGQHTGERLLTDHQVQQWQDLLEARSAWLNLQGIPYLFLIAPDPHAVYSDKLPEGVTPGETRPVLQILDHLAERGSWAPVMYPLRRCGTSATRSLPEDRFALVRVRRLHRLPRADGTADGDLPGAQAHAQGAAPVLRAARRRPRHKYDPPFSRATSTST